MHSRLTTMTAAAALLAGFGLAAGSAWADDTGDSITVNSTGDGDIGSQDGTASLDASTDSGRAFDDDFVSFYSVGEGGEVIISFADNVALAGGDSDPDIIVWERCGTDPTVNNADEAVDVDVSQGGAFTNDVVTNTTSDSASPMNTGVADKLVCPVDVDLDAVSLAAAVEVRVSDLCQGDGFGDSPGCDDETYGGIDIAEVQAVNNLAFGTFNISKSIDGDSDITETGADSGFDAQQFFTFEIEITNLNGVDLTGFTFRDVVPAEFDITGTSADNTGVNDLTANLGCVVVDASEGGAKGKGNGNQKLAPDVVTFTADLAAGDSCTVIVDVATDDDHPGGGNSPDWTPTSCPVPGELPLNDGVEVYDSATGDLIFIDDSTLALTCTLDAPT